MRRVEPSAEEAAAAAPGEPAAAAAAAAAAPGEPAAAAGAAAGGYVRSRVHLSGVNVTTNVTCTAINTIGATKHSDAHMFTLIVPGDLPGHEGNHQP